ncbi:hypothetical protein FQN49_004547, partial [Arthroderma sp. PD_2]
MSTAPIPPAINGVRGGRSHRGRSHKRNHGHSVNGTQQQFPSYPGVITPSKSTQPSAYLPNSAEEGFPPQYVDKQEPGLVGISNGGVSSNKYHNHASSASQDSFALGNVAGGHGQLRTDHLEHPSITSVVSDQALIYPDEADHSTSSIGLSWQLITGVLTALPFVASYLLTTVSAGFSESANSESKGVKIPRPRGLADSPILLSCAYVATALLVLGTYGKIRLGHRRDGVSATMPAHT